MKNLVSSFNDLLLEISPEISLNAWEKTPKYSTKLSKWRAYLNQVSQEAFLSYLEAEQDFPVRVWPSSPDSAKFWELVNGSVICFEQKRLVLLPTEAIDQDELRIPQEWVDIPTLAGDYFLAVQVNPEEEYVSICGYATHQQIKAKAKYDFRDRTYCLSGQHLISNLSILWATYELSPQEITKEYVASLPCIPSIQAENLIQRLSNNHILEPRLEIPFDLWGAILEQDTWRNQLVNNRLGIKVNKQVNLARWFDNIFDLGWESLDSIFPTSSPRSNLGGTRRFKSENSNNSLDVVKRAKYLEIAPNHGVVLEIEISPLEDQQTKVIVRLRPQLGDRYLPEGLKLKFKSNQNSALYATKASSGVNLIIKEFKFVSADSFTIKVSVDDFKFVEEFFL